VRPGALQLDRARSPGGRLPKRMLQICLRLCKATAGRLHLKEGADLHYQIEEQASVSKYVAGA
jgi:hypothetical protein